MSNYFGFGFIALQIFLIFAFKICFKRSKCFRKKCKELLFLKEGDALGQNDLMFKDAQERFQHAGDQLNKEAIDALKSSYEHPWIKIRRKIEFINKKQDFKANVKSDKKGQANSA